VQAGQFASGGGEGGEIGSEGDARQFAFEVVRKLLPVRRMVQDGVDVVEDVPLGDGGVAVVLAELLQGRVGDVLAPVRAVGGVVGPFVMLRIAFAFADENGRPLVCRCGFAGGKIERWFCGLRFVIA
jgi:hypothetical protein